MELKRSIFNELKEQKKRPEVSILLGARQVGKTFLMEALRRECEAAGQSTVFYNLEIPSDLHALVGKERDVFEKLTHNREGVLFVDEFHYLENASKIFKAIYDSRHPIKIFASGSSSIEIHKHLKESLAGRLWKNRIYPLSFKERCRDPEFPPSAFYQFGGLPGLVKENQTEDKIKALEMIVETYIQKDVKALIREENVRAFNHMIYLLAQYQGSLVPISSLAREIGLSEQTVKHHLQILSETFVCYSLTSFSKNLANELKKSQKYYLYDLGIRNLLLKNFKPLEDREDAGVIGESFIYHHLHYQLKPNMEIRFWRTKGGHEVDFILLIDQVPYPIEVKVTLGKPHVPDGMRKFLDAYPQSKAGIIFCRDIEGQIKHKGVPIQILPWERVEDLPLLTSAV